MFQLHCLQRLQPRWRRSAQPTAPTTEAGLTLIEAIVAMLLITITVSLITPPIFLVVATRVQNQRSEKALALAQGEVDRIRLLIEQGNLAAALAQTPLAAGVNAAQEADAPTTIQDTLADVTAANQAYWRDVDGDGTNDFFVQVYRSNEEETAGGSVLAFQLGVRVYQANAEENLSSLRNEAQVSTTTSGLGYQKIAPMAALYTTVARSNSEDSFAIYRQYTDTNF